jgi:serine/threonine protein kinase
MNPNQPADKSPPGRVRIGPEQVRSGGPEDAGAGDSPHDSTTPTLQHPIPSIPDHELLRRIGEGSYGEVWLARNVLGEFRAVKVIYRDNFEHDRPYEREIEGIQKFEPISRLHESQVDILHVGRNDAAGYFYYVMELADDAGAIPSDERRMQKETRKPNDKSDVVAGSLRSSGFGIPSRFDIRNSDLYVPHTLKLDLYRRGRLPPDECIQIGLALTTALEHLHAHGLVHRDIKPSNIIFINGVPKLADIGLVASIDATMSFVGTSGFLPPEGPGTPQADIYSLGKVLYEMSTGRDRQEFPKLPVDLGEFDEPQDLLELNSVILKSCHRDQRHRYQSAKEMAADLALLQRGASVRRKRAVEQRFTLAKKIASAVVVLALLNLNKRLRQAISTFGSFSSLVMTVCARNAVSRRS